jgi:cytochrome b561
VKLAELLNLNVLRCIMTIAINRANQKPETFAGERGYDLVARGLHWLMFALIAIQFMIGWTMPHIRRNTPQQGLVDWHLSIGAVLMFLVVVRLLWRWTHRTPLMTTMKPWERLAAALTHNLLYLLLLVIPVLGWMASGYFGFTVRLFGLFALPKLTDGTRRWAHEMGDVHVTLTYALIGVAGLHVLGALYHYFIRRDRVMQRMLPGV